MSVPSTPAESSAALESEGQSGEPDARVSPAEDHPDTTRADRLERRRIWLGRWGAAVAALISAWVVTMRTHVFFLYPYPTPVSNDEGYLAGMALRMIQGHWLPYVDGVSQRGPILYWITTLFFRAGGIWSWIPLRVLSMVLATLMLGLVFALGTVVFSPMAGGIASLVLTYFLTYELAPWDGVGVNGEPVAVVFALAAALLAARLQLKNPARRDRMAFWMGVLTACAGLSKQMFLLHAVPIGLWLLLGPVDPNQSPPPQRRREIGRFILGGAIPYVLVVGLYAATGHLSTFVYYYQRYGRDIFMDPLTLDYIRDKIREQIDRYFLGIAGVGAMFFWAIGRALSAAMEVRVEEGVAEPESPTAPRRALPWPPELHAALNLFVPGMGLAFVPRRRWQGPLFTVAAIGVIALRFVLRHRAEVPYTPAALTRDGMIWLAFGVLSLVVTAWWIVTDHPTLRWTGVVRVRATAGPWYVLAQMVCAFAGACFTFRFFPHYFVEFFPFASVVVGGVIAASYSKLDHKDRPNQYSAVTMVIGAVILLTIANSALARNVRMRRETDRWYQDPVADPIVRYVLERTTSDQRIFVWGFRAETYLSARRYPGSRYVYTVYPAGVVPWFQATHEEEERRQVPGSREELIEDLDREQPELVIDAGRSMNGRYMYNYPVLRAYLDRKYCFMRYVDGEPVYRRRHGERCPPADY